MSGILLHQLQSAISNSTFLDVVRQAAAGGIQEPPYDELGFIGTTGVNLRRFENWESRVILNPDLISTISEKDMHMKWVLINEPWCSDGSFTQPVLNKIAGASEGRISLSILLRDKHPEVMDQFLTKGGRAIPKLIALNDQNKVMWTWGPRPEELQDIVGKIVRDPDCDHNEKIRVITRWSMKNKGVSMQRELLQLIKAHKY
ncbi:MAG: thioredoxin family protein [Bacteroidetes bacterium]|nr:thioredoxin family protein [Bacteroidota bacterium]